MIAVNSKPLSARPLREVGRLYKAWARLKPEWVRTLPPPFAESASVVRGKVNQSKHEPAAR